MQIFTETERLILREILPEDEKGIFQLDSDPDVQQFLGNKPIKSIEEARQIIKFIRQQYIDNGIGRWAVIEKSSDNFIGWAGLKLIKEPVNNHCNYYDLGYRFIKPYWGQGFATEAATAALNYGFYDMKLNEVFAMTEEGNVNSKHVLQKIGLKFIETFEHESVRHSWYKIAARG
ncbi:MAG TPA: GNAT family N-acetyltransferase [Pedobacter sp.]